MALSTTSNNQQLVNARILSEIAVQFNIGADILGKGNRTIEKHLGAEKMSGDTVMVPIVGSGEVYDGLDLSGKDLSVQRDAVPVTVGPLTTAAVVDQETLALSIKNPEIMAKRVANMAMTANVRAYKTLVANALNSKVINNEDIDGAIAGTTATNGYLGRAKIYEMIALCEASKFAGETFGVVHPLAWAKLIAMFQGNYAPNTKEGSDLYKNELGNLAGINWTKGQHLEVITAKDVTGVSIAFDYSGVFNRDGYDVQAPMAVPSTGDYATVTGAVSAFSKPAAQIKKGDISQPFTLPGVYSTDIFGNSTDQLATFHLVARVNGASADNQFRIAGPVFFEGPRQNVYSADYDKAAHTLASVTAAQLLTVNRRYLPPAVVWKKDDFLVAVKGLEKFFGCDSLTVPTQYREKGILPLRGLCWTDPVKASTIFRVDVLLGMAAFLRVSINSVYIQAD